METFLQETITKKGKNLFLDELCCEGKKTKKSPSQSKKKQKNLKSCKKGTIRTIFFTKKVKNLCFFDDFLQSVEKA